MVYSVCCRVYAATVVVARGGRKIVCGVILWLWCDCGGVLWNHRTVSCGCCHGWR